MKKNDLKRKLGFKPDNTLKENTGLIILYLSLVFFPLFYGLLVLIKGAE